ncbi:hypothetical protein HDV62DRAFT_314573 [Trichoderma sp. SZMC 28011]
MIDYDLARRLATGSRGRELSRMVYKGTSQYGYYEYDNYYHSDICDICGTAGYRFTRAYTLHVRHAGRSGGDYQTSNRPVPRLCRKGSPWLPLIGILCTPSGQDGHCALRYAPFLESQMLPDDGAHRRIYPNLAVILPCVPKITVLNHVPQQLFDGDLPPLDRQHACHETPGETAQRLSARWERLCVDRRPCIKLMFVKQRLASWAYNMTVLFQSRLSNSRGQQGDQTCSCVEVD